MGPAQAEPEGFGGSKVEGENDVWSHFSPQPEGMGPIFPISLSLVASRHPVCVAPRFLELGKIGSCHHHSNSVNRP
jgi:hypothetical protein